jgi:hypothetical protein
MVKLYHVHASANTAKHGQSFQLLEVVICIHRIHHVVSRTAHLKLKIRPNKLLGVKFSTKYKLIN